MSIQIRTIHVTQDNYCREKKRLNNYCNQCNPARCAIRHLRYLIINNDMPGFVCLRRGNASLLAVKHGLTFYRHHMLNHVEEIPQGDPELALAGDDPELQQQFRVNRAHTYRGHSLDSNSAIYNFATEDLN